MDVWPVLIVTDGDARGGPPVATAFIAAFEHGYEAEQAVRREVGAPIHSVALFTLPEAVATAFELKPESVRRLVEGVPKGDPF